MGYATILGLDLGKFKSVCCAMNMATGDHAFETIQTTPAALHELLAHHAGDDPSAVLLVIETCDAAGWVHDLAAALGVSVTVVHTSGDERWRWRRVKRKTDRDDALKLARLARLGELPHPPVHVPAPASTGAWFCTAAPSSRGARRAATASAQSTTSRGSAWRAGTSSGRVPAWRSCAPMPGRSSRATTRWTCGAGGSAPSWR
jgi:hypothetical protein